MSLKRNTPLDDMTTRLQRDLPHLLKDIDVSTLAHPTEADKNRFNGVLVDVLGIVKDSMGLGEKEALGLSALQGERLRAIQVKSDSGQVEGPNVAVAENPGFLKFLKSLISDMDSFNKSGAQHLYTQTCEESPVPPGFREAAGPLKTLYSEIDSGGISVLDKPYVNDLVNSALYLNNWRTVDLLGLDNAKAYMGRVDLAMKVMYKTMQSYGR